MNEGGTSERAFVSIDGEEYVPRRRLEELRAPRQCFLVRQTCGPAWDYSRRRREQDGWDEHAAFMDALLEEGFVFLGGPTGDPDSGDPLLVVEAADEAAVQARLATDPWMDTVLEIRSIEPWTIWLRR